MTFTLCPLRKYRSFTLELCYPPNEGAFDVYSEFTRKSETRFIIEIKRTESFHRHHSPLYQKLPAHVSNVDSVKPNRKLKVAVKQFNRLLQISINNKFLIFSFIFCSRSLSHSRVQHTKMHCLSTVYRLERRISL